MLSMSISITERNILFILLLYYFTKRRIWANGPKKGLLFWQQSEMGGEFNAASTNEAFYLKKMQLYQLDVNLKNSKFGCVMIR